MQAFYKKYSAYLLIAFVWLLVGVGVLLRSYQADIFPIDNNDDGLFYVWAGNSFITNPLQVQSHTIFDSGNQALLWRSQYHDYIPHLRFGMKIAQPWFDHPPFGTVLIGLPAHLLGFTEIEQLPHLVVRYPAIIASILTLFLTYLFTKKIFGAKAGIKALLFMATTPYFVFAHRQSYLENMMTPIFLASIISFLYYLDFKSKNFLFLSAGLAFLCGWIKIPFFAVPLMFMAWGIYKKDLLVVKTFLITAALSIFSYISYGLIADKAFFIETISNQGVRGMYLSSFIHSFTKPMFYGEFMDGQYILGLLFCFALLIKKDKTEKEIFFSWFFVAWILVLFLISGKFNNSPWYRYPLLPFMAGALGVYGQFLYEKRNLFLVVLFIIFGLTSFDLAGIEFSSSLLRPAVILLVLPFLTQFMFPKFKFADQLTKIWIIVLFMVIVAGNILAVQKYPYQRCEQENCLLPNKIILE